MDQAYQKRQSIAITKSTFIWQLCLYGLTSKGTLIISKTNIYTETTINTPPAAYVSNSETDTTPSKEPLDVNSKKRISWWIILMLLNKISRHLFHLMTRVTLVVKLTMVTKCLIQTLIQTKLLNWRIILAGANKIDFSKPFPCI